jgi:hypothetical protein
MIDIPRTSSSYAQWQLNFTAPGSKRNASTANHPGLDNFATWGEADAAHGITCTLVFSFLFSGITVSPLFTLWLCLSCVCKTSDNAEDLMFGLIAGQALNMSQNKAPVSDNSSNSRPISLRIMIQDVPSLCSGMGADC